MLVRDDGTTQDNLFPFKDMGEYVLDISRISSQDLETFFRSGLHGIEGACAIPQVSTASVVLTGGHNWPRRGSRYSRRGWEADMDSMIFGRWTHGCSSFMRDNREVAAIDRSKLNTMQSTFNVQGPGCGWRLLHWAEQSSGDCGGARGREMEAGQLLLPPPHDHTCVDSHSSGG